MQEAMAAIAGRIHVAIEELDSGRIDGARFVLEIIKRVLPAPTEKSLDLSRRAAKDFHSIKEIQAKGDSNALD